jgi:hypothetical protein
MPPPYAFVGCVIKHGYNFNFFAYFQLYFYTVWLFLTDYFTHFMAYNVFREFVSVSSKLLCQENVTFLKGIVLSDLGGGGETWTMYGPHSLLCVGDELKICGLVHNFFSEIVFPSLKCNLWVKTTLLIIKRPPLLPPTHKLFVVTYKCYAFGHVILTFSYIPIGL